MIKYLWTPSLCSLVTLWCQGKESLFKLYRICVWDRFFKFTCCLDSHTFKIKRIREVLHIFDCSTIMPFHHDHDIVYSVEWQMISYSKQPYRLKKLTFYYSIHVMITSLLPYYHRFISNSVSFSSCVYFYTIEKMHCWSVHDQIVRLLIPHQKRRFAPFPLPAEEFAFLLFPPVHHVPCHKNIGNWEALSTRFLAKWLRSPECHFPFLPITAD